MKKREWKQKAIDAEERLASLRRVLGRQADLLKKVIESRKAPKGMGIWGNAPDLFWVSVEHETGQLILLPAMLLLNGRVVRSASPPYDTREWKLMSKDELLSEYRGVNLERIVTIKPIDDSPCPEVKFPLGTTEHLETLLESLNSWCKG